MLFEKKKDVVFKYFDVPHNAYCNAIISSFCLVVCCGMFLLLLWESYLSSL